MPLSGASKEGWMARMLRTMDDASMSGGRLELKLCRGLFAFVAVVSFTVLCFSSIMCSR